jgi:hypothetical protein
MVESDIILLYIRSHVWGIIHAVGPGVVVDVSYAAPQAHGIVNVALHREYSPGIIFLFFQGRKDLYLV